MMRGMGDPTATAEPAGLFRRLAALFYDALLAVALAAAVTFAMLPFTRGEALLASTQGLLARAYHGLLALVLFAYFGWSWTRRGRTLGMRAWRIRLEAASGRLPGWGESLARCLLAAGLMWLAVLGAWYVTRPGSSLAHAGAVALMAPLVLNFAWVPFDRERRSLIDVAARTRVRRVA